MSLKLSMVIVLAATSFMICAAEPTQDTTDKSSAQCQFQYHYAGAMLDGVYNGSVICDNVTLPTLEVNGHAKLEDTQITQKLFVDGNVELDHAELKDATVKGSVTGRDCKITGKLKLYGNHATFKRCAVHDIEVYDNGVSAFTPTVTLIRSKVTGTVHFVKREGRVVEK